jgi:hypothetical protein
MNYAFSFRTLHFWIQTTWRCVVGCSGTFIDVFGCFHFFSLQLISDLRVVANTKRFLDLLLAERVVDHCLPLDSLHGFGNWAFWLDEKSFAAILSPLHITFRVEHVVFKVFSHALPCVVRQLIDFDLALQIVNTRDT